MEITKKGNMLVIGTRSILISSIRFVDHDTDFVYVALSDVEPGKMKDQEGITIPYASVTVPQEFLTAADLHTWIDTVRNHTGIVNGTKVIVLSDTLPCVNGYIRVKANGTGGIIKYTTVDGDVDSDTFEPGETSTFRVCQIWATGTAVAVGDIRILV